jgi:hypothetical protein
MKLSILFLSIIISSQVYGCRYVIDEKAVSKELMSVGLSNVTGGVDTVKIINSNVIKFDFFESISTPMCPKEMTYKAKVQVSFEQKSSYSYPQFCSGVVEVTKIEPWDSLEADTYKVSGVKTIKCTN